MKFDMKMFVNVARLDIGQLFTQSTRRGHPCTLDTFLFIHLVEPKTMFSDLFYIYCILFCHKNYTNLGIHSVKCH